MKTLKCDLSDNFISNKWVILLIHCFTIQGIWRIYYFTVMSSIEKCCGGTVHILKANVGAQSSYPIMTKIIIKGIMYYWLVNK